MTRLVFFYELLILLFNNFLIFFVSFTPLQKIAFDFILSDVMVYFIYFLRYFSLPSNSVFFIEWIGILKWICFGTFWVVSSSRLNILVQLLAQKIRALRIKFKVFFWIKYLSIIITFLFASFFRKTRHSFLNL